MRPVVKHLTYFARVFSLALMFILSVYFGIGGLSVLSLEEKLERMEKNEQHLKLQKAEVTIDGVYFENAFELKYYMERRSVEKFFPLFFEMEGFLPLAVTTFALGMFGGFLRVAIDLTFLGKNLERTKLFSIPFAGFLISLLIVGVVFLTGWELKPMGLCFLCLLSGVFSKLCFKYIKKRLIKKLV